MADAILGRGASREDYERATGWDFDSNDAFQTHLRKLWDVIYPGVPHDATAHPSDKDR